MNDRIEYRPMQHAEEPEEPPRIVPPSARYAATVIASALSGSLLTWLLSSAAPVRVETREVPVVREVVKEVPVIKEVVREVPKEVPVVQTVKEYVPLPTTDKLVEKTVEKCVPVQTNVVRQVAAPKPKPKPRPAMRVEEMFRPDPNVPEAGYYTRPVYRY
ncbi:hypothetical protein [Methylorubrum sp. SB2]|uniref:hypothetical protein n=1 Tax=Methylorubrum subtropicum TaxID=3138812 RepID=UPI00313D5FE6